MLLIRDWTHPRSKAGNDPRIPLFAATGFDAWARIMAQAKHVGYPSAGRPASKGAFPLNGRSLPL